jgi:uncharacterized protein with PIN domain
MHENQLTVKCPNCKDNLIKSHEHEVKMRVLMMKWNGEGCFAVCKSCKSDVEIDFEILKKLNTFFTYEAKKG